MLRACTVLKDRLADLRKVLQGADVPSRIVDAANVEAEPAGTATILQREELNQRELDVSPLDSTTHPRIEDMPATIIFDPNIDMTVDRR
jgi:hypothetical protein